MPLPPVAVGAPPIAVLAVLHMVLSAPADAVGFALIVTTIASVEVHPLLSRIDIV